MIYQWKSGCRHKTDPEVAAAEMNRLAEMNQLNAEALVEASRPADAPLHCEFEWDDTKAAEEYRKHQGRNLINAIIIINDEQENPEPIRAYFQTEEKSSNYEPINVILQSVDKTDTLRKQALNELLSYRSKYHTILKAIDGMYLVDQLQMKLDVGT